MALAYQTALTIESVIKDIDSKKYLLPSIQREFVWSTGQIEKLFDSLMRDYPINAFLFWKVPREKVSEFKFYEFLRDYHQKDNKHNPKANTNGTEDIIAILDGQQVVLFLWKRLLTDSKEQIGILNLQMILLRICCGQNMAAVMHWWFYRYCILGQI